MTTATLPAAASTAVPTAAPYATWPSIRLMESAVSAAPDGFHRSWIMYMPLGKYHHPEYGNLDFTRAKLAEFKRKFDGRVRGIDIALDCDHKTGEAPGWIERLALHEGNTGAQIGDPALTGRTPGLYALIKWTPLGVQLLKEQRYRYFSPEFGTHFDEVTGKKTPGVILGGALTNRPFLKSMDAVALAEKQPQRMSTQLSEGVSRRPWGEVDKSSLPDSAFLDRKNRRLPVYEGAGPKDAKGRYTKRGPLNINGVEAALRAIHGARTGKPMTGLPAGLVARLERWIKQYGQSDDSQQHSEPRSESRSVVAPATPARSKTRMTKSQVALQAAALADDEDEDNSDEPQELDEATYQAERRQFSGKAGKGSGKVSPEDKKVDAAIAALKKAQQKDEDDEDTEEMADPSIQDEMEYADDAEDEEDGGADEAEEGGVDEEEDTHGPITTPKRGHKHGKYGFHTHADDADHSDAPLAEDAEKMSERQVATAAAALAEDAMQQSPLGALAYFLSEREDDADWTLEDKRQIKAVLRQMAEREVLLTEQRYREDVTRLSEDFVTTIGLSDEGDPTLPEPFSVAPSKVFRERFEAFMLSEDGRGLSDEGRNEVCRLIQTAYLRGAVPQGHVSKQAPDATAPLPPAKAGSRADLPAASASASAAAASGAGGPQSAPRQTRTMRLAEGLAQERFSMSLHELGRKRFEDYRKVMNEAAKQANYRGAEHGTR